MRADRSGGGAVSPAEQARKLAQIREIETVEGVAGWRLGLHLSGRAPIDGELAALAARERELLGSRGRA